MIVGILITFLVDMWITYCVVDNFGYKIDINFNNVVKEFEKQEKINSDTKLSMKVLIEENRRLKEKIKEIERR